MKKGNNFNKFMSIVSFYSHTVSNVFFIHSDKFSIYLVTRKLVAELRLLETLRTWVPWIIASFLLRHWLFIFRFILLYLLVVEIFFIPLFLSSQISYGKQLAEQRMARSWLRQVYSLLFPSWEAWALGNPETICTV